MRPVLYNILGSILLLWGHPLMGQTQVVNYTAPEAVGGITYSLPKTCFAVVIKAEKSIYKPGELCNYSEAFFKQKALENSYDNWRLSSVNLISFGVPDEQKTYSISLKKGTTAPFVQLSPNGLLLSINTPADNLPTLPHPEVKKLNDTKVNAKDFLSDEILATGSLQKMAELTANEIFDIRESRNLLTKGQADYMPKDGEQLKLMLKQLDEKENALLQLFKGSYQTEEHTFILPIVPTEGESMLCRFSKYFGVVDKEDLSGEPLYLKIKDLKSLTTTPTISPKYLKKLEETAIRYCIPGMAEVKIFDKQRVFYQQTLPIAQFGQIAYLEGVLFNKNTKTKVLLNAITGNIEDVKQ